jgi:zinc D-Ala-D-Ala carboxypeptidase
MMLTEHFSLAELTKSQTAERMGIKNSPSEDQVLSLSRLCENILEPTRENYGIPFSPSSCFRSSTLNNMVGGASNSQHVDGCAADIEISGVDNLELARWIERNLFYDQLILEHYVLGNADSGWVHVSYRFDSNRMQSLRFDGTSYLVGLTEEPRSSLTFYILKTVRDCFAKITRRNK